jgi:hemerythrin
MPLIQWSGALYVNNQEINNQHFQFVVILNELYEALLWSEGEEFIHQTLDKLDEYARTHFTYEEGVMAEMNSPLLAEHQAEHEKFRQKIRELRKSFENGITTVDMELSAYLNHWMVNHIKKMDRDTFG